MTVVKELVVRLEKERQAAERKLGDIQNAVHMMVQSLPSLENTHITVETGWLRKLWKAADCQWEAKTADSFLSRWIATHQILSKAFNLFRSKKRETFLEKLQALRIACDHAKEALGYNKGSEFDVTPEDLVGTKQGKKC